MIQVNELRVGNWIFLEDGKLLPSILNNLAKDQECEQLIGIPITNVRLKECGFKHCGGAKVWDVLKLSDFDEVWWITGMYFITNEDERWILHYCTDEDTYMELCDVKYVHQLQNAIFSLTGKELEINICP